ncbi:MAG: class II fructose-bisphosphatase [Deltaproteobacteria bacterium]|nr:class II fructose-bisphosphatase [Deltaproteobacteria bacterium]
MERNLALEAVRATEAAALSSARLMGRGDNDAADQAAVDGMRRALNSIAFQGTVVIGEGERDEAPMLYIGEKVGLGSGTHVDIALDPLEGTNLAASGGPNAISVIALASRGHFLHAPDTYMQKIAVGPSSKGIIDIREAPTWNLQQIAKKRGCDLEDLTVVILNRPRHEDLICEVRRAGARIKLISDGDVSAALATCWKESGIDCLMGIGGAPEGVIAAAALKCLRGDIQAILKPRNHEEIARMKQMGITDLNRVYSLEDLAAGEVMFAATGVTTGDFLKGVRFFGGGAETHSVVMRSQSGTIRFIEARHYFETKPVY